MKNDRKNKSEGINSIFIWIQLDEEIKKSSSHKNDELIVEFNHIGCYTFN